MAVTLCCCHFFVCAQNRNSIWCFGDSALINFSDTSNIIVGSCGLDSRGSCVSICDNNGQLVFSAATRANSGTYTTLVFDSQNNIMPNGDTIMGVGWYNELIIIPNPLNDSTYFLFSLGVTSFYGIYYSVIDMKLNNGLGDVTQKNIQLQSFPMIDCLNAVKHGNGRDWWIIFRRDPQFNPSNEFSTYLISPSGINNYTQQNVGGPVYANNADVEFSPSGTKVAVTSYNGLIEILNYDRCTGQLTLQHHIQTGVLVSPTPALWSVAFSPDESKLYMTSNDITSHIYQYDLNAANIPGSKDTIWSTYFPPYACGDLKLAPDNRIYLSSVYYTSSVLYYPYADSMYNMYNMNLSVINSPDSLGSACNFQPYSFYLGGKRTYLGLPNNPDYELPSLVGSPCDTLTSITEFLGLQPSAIFVFYHPAWQKAFINVKGLKGKNYSLEIVDIFGKSIYLQKGVLNSEYFTKDLQCFSFAKGVYMAIFQTDKEKLLKKFVIR